MKSTTAATVFLTLGLAAFVQMATASCDSQYNQCVKDNAADIAACDAQQAICNGGFTHFKRDAYDDIQDDKVDGH